MNDATFTDAYLLDLVLCALVLVTAVMIIQVRSLFAASMIASAYSLLMCMVWTNMRALDVGFTEASVGAGISTIVLLGALTHVGRHEKVRTGGPDWKALGVCLVTGALLVWGTLDMPRYGEPDAPIHTLRVPKLMDQSVGKLPGQPPLGTDPIDPAHPHPRDDFNGHVPNSVTSLLAAYRGYDTMYETTVIFTAGISVVMLLRRRRRDPDGSQA